MNVNSRQAMVRGAVLLAIALCFQSIRLVVPLPPFIGMFIIGSLVNATLLIATRYAGVMPTILIGILLPIVAYFQGQLPLPIFIPAVMAGNFVVVFFAQFFWQSNVIWAMPVVKALVLSTGVYLFIQCFAIPDKIAKAIFMMMSWPQVVTGFIGILLARQIDKKIQWKA